MKKQIAIFVMLAVLCSSFAFSVSAEGAVRPQGPPFQDILAYQPHSGTTGCTNSRLIYAGNGLLTMQEENGNGFVALETVIINQNGYHVWGQSL